MNPDQTAHVAARDLLEPLNAITEAWTTLRRIRATIALLTARPAENDFEEAIALLGDALAQAEEEMEKALRLAGERTGLQLV